MIITISQTQMITMTTPATSMTKVTYHSRDSASRANAADHRHIGPDDGGPRPQTAVPPPWARGVPVDTSRSREAWISYRGLTRFMGGVRSHPGVIGLMVARVASTITPT